MNNETGLKLSVSTVAAIRIERRSETYESGSRSHHFASIEPIPEEVDYTPDQWDDSELYPWDCDLGVPWTY